MNYERAKELNDLPDYDFYEVMSELATSDDFRQILKAKCNNTSADALSYMALAGWSTEDSIKGLEPILRVSESTGADLATTSDLITDSMSAMGVSVDGLTEYLDVCAAAQNNSNTTLTQLQEAFITAGATLHSFNTGSKEGAALLGVKVAITAETTHIEGPTQSGSDTPNLNPYNKHNATGTTYFGGGWTTINKNGPELVNLPTGTSIIPAYKSRKIGTGTTLNNTVNLYFGGSLFGDEEAADFIGNKVCEKLYDYVTAL